MINQADLNEESSVILFWQTTWALVFQRGNGNLNLSSPDLFFSSFPQNFDIS